MTGAVIALLGGLVLLGVGAEGLVRGASRLAARLRVPPLLVGLTIVAYGTSAPETAVSAAGAVAGRGDLVLGNALGSNVFNGLAILGVAALVAPLAAQARIVRIDAPLVVAATLAVWVLAWDGTLGRSDGLLLIGAGLAYTALVVVAGRSAARHASERATGEAATTPETHRTGGAGVAIDVLVLVLSLVLLVTGSRWLVDGAVTLARAAGLSDLSVALGVALVCVPLAFTGGRISRWEGAVLLGFYLAYLAWLLADATGHAQAENLGAALAGFVVPLSALAFGALAVGEVRRRGGRGSRR
ncbi:MAG: hypothetical protein GVY27_09385 [Deinococcus-Thermus bacterium]|nr:hypothetical protein [Deinococcota bacterium]